MHTIWKYLVAALLCVLLLIPCACSQEASDPPASPPPSSSHVPESEAAVPSAAPEEVPSPSEAVPSPAPDTTPTPPAGQPTRAPDEENQLTYILDGKQDTLPALRHHSSHGYSMVYDTTHYEHRSQFEVESYWSEVGLYLSFSIVYNMPLDYVLDGLQLQENIEMGAQPVYIGAGLYPAYTLYRTTEDGKFRQFWALDYGTDTLLIERSYPVEHEYASFHHAVQDAMLATLILDNSPTTAPGGMSAAYAAVLEDTIREYNQDPEPTFGELSDNRFAICDIDGDGQMELIIEYTTCIVAGMNFRIYGYDAETDTVRLQLLEFPNAQVFSNGTIEVGAAHNHSYSGVFWPYTLYQYDAADDSYVNVGSVSGWDVMVMEEDFPCHIDEDGDGLVYYISAEGYDPATPVDGADYFAWRSFYTGAAQAVQLPYLPLTAENVENLK